MSRLWRFSSLAAVSALITALGYGFYVYRAEGITTQEHLRMARQLVAQAENLTRHAEESKIPDPFRWTAEILKQNTVNRTYEIYPGRFRTEKDVGVETYYLDREAGDFDYVRIIRPKTREGFRVRIRVPYEGFLGASNVGGNGVALLATFGFFFLFLHLLTRKRTDLERALMTVDFQTRSELREWATGARRQVISLGLHLLKVLNGSRELVQLVNRSKGRLKSTTETVEAARKSLAEAQIHFQSIGQSGAEVDRLMDAFARNPPSDAKVLQQRIHEFQHHIKDIVQTNRLQGSALEILASRILTLQQQIIEIEGWYGKTDECRRNMADMMKETSGEFQSHADQVEELSSTVAAE